MLGSAYDRLVSRIYEAPLHPERWDSVLQDVLSLLGAYNGHIYVYDHIEGQGCNQSSIGLDPAYGAIFNERFADSPPPCMTAGAGREIVRNSLQLISPRLMYEEFFRPQEMHHVLLGHLLDTPEKSCVFAATRPASWSSFAAEQQRLSAALLPHLRRALALEGELQKAHERARFAEEVLDHVSSAILVFDEEGRFLRSNQVGAKLLRSSPGLGLSARGLLRAARPEDTDRLQEAFGRASRRSSPEGSTLSLPQPGSRRPLLLRFSPVRNTHVRWLPETPSVLVFVSDPSQKTEEPFAALARLYGLTPAESLVGVEIIRGKSPREITELLSITLPTVRSHLRRIFQRTGTKNQREFVALVLRALAGGREARGDEEE